MIRGNKTAVTKLKSGEITGVPEDRGKRILQFATGMPDDIVVDLHDAITRFRENTRKQRYSPQNAFFDCLAAATDVTEDVRSGSPNSVTLSSVYIGRQLYQLWGTSTSEGPTNRTEALARLGKEIAIKNKIPHRYAPHHVKIKHLPELPTQSTHLSNSPYYDSLPVQTSVPLDQSIPESQLTNAIIEAASEWSPTHLLPEMSYNHYGDRGSVDLYVNGAPLDQNLTPRCTAFVMEMKSEHAIRESTGPNSIIQQFNRMRENFFPGNESEDVGTVGEFVNFELAFTPSEHCIRHLFEYQSMYQGCLSQQLADSDSVWPEKQNPEENSINYVCESVTIRIPDPENPVPIHVFGSGADPDPSSRADYKRYLLRVAPRFHDKFWNVIVEYL